MKKVKGRVKRHKALRKKLIGTKERPRLCIFRSSKNLYAQLVDDVGGHTMFSFSTNVAALKNKTPYGGNGKAALTLGEEFAKKAFEHVGLNYKDHIVIDKNLNRPAEVDTLLANCEKAKKELNWQPKTTFDDLVKIMTEHDLELTTNSM